MQSVRLDQFDVIIWDFDGVILDSAEVRDHGFLEIFSNYPEHQVSQLMDFHKSNGGLSRYVKIRHFFEEILMTSVTEDQVNYYANEFKQIMLSKLTDRDLIINDSLAFIKENHQKQKFYIASGSDEKELNIICSKWDWLIFLLR